MTSDSKKDAPTTAYVWVWLPGTTKPVVAGRLDRNGQEYSFTYGKSYLARKGAMPLYLPELPLQAGQIRPLAPLRLANCLRDGAPDAWGRRIIINRLTGLKRKDAQDIDFDELTFFLSSGSDRAGALDFQASATDYAPREEADATLEELMEAAGLVERGEAIPKSLDVALFHGSSIGGARPKALITDGAKKYIAKFSASTDVYPVVKAEFLAMRLAKRAGLNAAAVELREAAGKAVLLVERFDRKKVDAGWQRKSMVSALTLFGLDELQAHHASYAELAEIIRARFTAPQATLRELYGRMVFNVLCSNTDDHARNQSAFWDGAMLTLTPAYDICPQVRNNREANQSLIIADGVRRSQLEVCRNAAAHFLLTDTAAREIIDTTAETVRSRWAEVCDEARLTKIERDFLWQRQFLNPYAFEGYAV
jgi:serine/threonine-protein kinase HipA